jgi:hypothetical protein
LAALPEIINEDRDCSDVRNEAPALIARRVVVLFPESPKQPIQVLAG